MNNKVGLQFQVQNLKKIKNGLLELILAVSYQRKSGELVSNNI